MLLPREPTVKQRRDGPGSRTAIIVVVSIAIVLAAGVIVFIILKTIRSRYPNPKYVPTKFLKRKWEAWTPTGLISSKGNYSSRLQENSSVPTLHHLRSGDRSARASALNLSAQAPDATENGAGATVDRQTSVRSVMTLPVYSRSVRENEQVLGREGDRDGVDVIVDLPETVEEEEERREEEMESLYQIRVQRRQEVAEREARRQERRDARARGDNVTLERLRQESALRTEEQDLNGTAAMIAEHQSRSRERRVSSVSYAEVGVARHDGTRVRANSDESERPLLDSAASIGGGTIRPWSAHDSASLRAHNRGRSGSSAISISDNDADFAPPFGRAGSHYEIATMNQSQSRNVSNSRTPSASRRASSNSAPVRPSVDTGIDLGETPLPTFQPPSYESGGFEDAPPYTSPVRDRATTEAAPEMQRADSGAPVLPGISRLPTIRIAESTPIEPRENAEWSSVSQEREAGQT